MTTDSAVSIAWDVFKVVFVPIKHQFEYVMCSKRYADGLRKEVGNLEYEAVRVRNAAEEATDNLRNTHEWVEKFLASAEKALDEARDLLSKFENMSKTCCHGTLPNPICHYRFSREAKHKTDDNKNLILENRDREISLSRPAPGNVVPTPAPDDGVFKSRASVIQAIMDALADDTKSVVGVHGMGGVGKSTLLADVERRIREEKSFDLVAKADVSENPDIKRIQGEIAHALGLDIKNEEYVNVRAEILCRRLENDKARKQKKVLIILDNLWKGLYLKSVGIPCGHDNKVIGCKLLLTSRNRDVLRRDMGCDRDFLLGELQEEEAKRLFERMVGGKVHGDEFKPLVEKALNICAGLPFLILAIAKLFIDTSYSACKDALKQIWNEETGEVINKTLRLSYDSIKCEEAKLLLQLCVAYGVSKPSLEDLVRYGVGLRLFQEVSSMEEARDRLSSLIRTLQASSLLLDNEDANGFKIHDLVRGFVTSIASRDRPLLVLKDKDKLVTELSKDKLKICKAICFPWVDLEELPGELDCPELQIFLLLTNNKPLDVPDSYFNSMRNLLVLDLTGIRLSRSPSPFKFLESLHTLCLDYCSLEDVAILGELKGLQVLSFINSNIHRLSKEIGQLVELRLLDLSCCSRLEIIEPGVLRSLIKLEELYMEDSFDQWNAVEQTSPTNASLIELNYMKNLCTLHVSIPDPSVFPEDLNVKKLTKYRIRIGNVGRSQSRKGSSTLELKLDLRSNILQKGYIQSILDKTDDLFLDGLDRIEQSICAFSSQGFPKLKHLQVKNSPPIHYILQSPFHTYFKTLESLLLENLINLEKICTNNISSKSFSALKLIRVKSCDNMEVLFPLSLLRELPWLEEIKVVGCKLMQGIVEVDDCGKVELRNLHVLKLRDLPNIKNFFTAGTAPSSSTSDHQVGTQIAFFNGQLVSVPSLESLTMERLPNLKEIWSDESPLELTNLQSLKVVRCKSLSKVISSRSLLKLHKLHALTIEDCVSVQEIFDLDGPSTGGDVKTLSQLTTLELNELQSLRRIWNKNPCGIVGFQSLKKLEVYNSDNLEFIFFPSMVKSLAQLRDLTVSNCKKMETIITEEEGLGMETSETPTFPMLTNLRLKWLNSLTCFSSGKCSREARSQDLIQSCSTALFNGEVSIPSLESLTMEGLPNVKEIWSDESPLGQSNLQSLDVVGCESLTKVITSRSLSKLHKLHTLTIKDCVAVQEIFDIDGPSTSGNVETLSQLTTLELNELPSLRCIWNKSPCGIVSFHNLKELEVNDFDNLEFLFFPSMVKSLTQLRDLSISNCKKMESIITEEEGLGMETSETPTFPILTNLRLKRLESLTCFSRGKCSREAQCQDCIQSRSTALFNREVAFPRLETLDVTSLDKLGFIFFPSMIKSLAQLKKLSVSYCEKMEAIITEEEGLGMETSETLAFPMLIDLRLHGLQSLTCFSREKCSREARSQDRIQSHSTALFNREVSIPSLESLTIEGLPNLEGIWSNESPLELCNLQSLNVVQCESLSKVISSRSLLKLHKLHTLTIKDCIAVQEIFDLDGPSASGNVENLSQLTTLKLNELPSLRRIWNKNPCGTISFQSLKKLKVDNCNDLGFLFFPSMVKSLAQLRDLIVSNCKNLEAIVTEEEGLGMEMSKTLAFPMLTNLCLRWLESLTCFSRGKCSREARTQDRIQSRSTALFNREVAFPRLETLDVTSLDKLGFIFFPSMIKSLAQLKKLSVSYCEKMEAIITEEEGLGIETSETLAFPMLIGLCLDGLQSLTCFSREKCSREARSQDRIQSCSTALFNQEVAFPSSGGYTLKFPLLEDVNVTRCPNMKFFSDGPIEAPKLESVQVAMNKWYGPTTYLYFWKGNLNITIQNMFEEMGTFVGVEEMQLSEFPQLIGKWHSELNPIKSSWQLRSLVVDKCPSFVNAIPSRLMLVLGNMSTLQVRDCESLEEIFDLEGLEATESTRVLLSFLILDLVNLPKLRRLWNKDLQGMMCFHSLSNLTFYKCSNLRHAFAPSMAGCLANLERIEIKECSQMEGVITEDEGQGSVVETITFPGLCLINLECLPSLTGFLTGKNQKLECPQLVSLTIAHCPRMRSLTCQSWMENDHGTLSLFNPQVQFPWLSEIVLSHMDNLSKLWIDSPRETLAFDYLREVEVRNCKSLVNLFPHWVATSLTRLEKLRVESCGIEEIVTSGDDTPHSNIVPVLFPELTSLVLHDMPQLKSFCTNLPTLKWPFLKELRVTHCEKVNMLSFVASMNKWTHKDNQQDLSDQEAHSTFERDFPNLERLLLVDKDIQMIQDEKFPEDIFAEPEALTLACFHDEKAVFPLNFLLERFQNLQSLEVFCSSFEAIFPYEGLVDEEKHSVLENLRELKLSKLHNLNNVWRGDYLEAKILRSIKTFEVWDCPCLTTIFPAATSFRNLTKLVVKDSSGLEHLVTVSTVTNLAHLTDMTIIGCERMKEVVANDENGEGKVISLRKLESLTLQQLPSLECFSSTTSCNFSFPSLRDITVEECPKMKIFSKGTLSTPKLRYAQLFEYKLEEGNLREDLNIAIQKLSAA